MNLAERCAWDGGLIVASAPWDVADAIQRHQATPEHRAARRRMDKREANATYRARIRGEVDEVRLLRDLRRENGIAA